MFLVLWMVLSRYIRQNYLVLFFQSDFKFVGHVDAMLKLCSQRLFMFKQLHDQGMARGHLHTLFQTIVLNRITHAFPAWGPFLTIALSQRINGYFKRSYRYGFTNHVFKVHDFDSTMRDLFTKTACIHCCHPREDVVN